MTVTGMIVVAFSCWASWWLATRPEPESPTERARRKHDAWWAVYRTWRRAMADWERRDRTRRRLALPRLPAPVPPWGSSAEQRVPRRPFVPRLAVWL